MAGEKETGTSARSLKQKTRKRKGEQSDVQAQTAAQAVTTRTQDALHGWLNASNTNIDKGHKNYESEKRRRVAVPVSSTGKDDSNVSTTTTARRSRIGILK